ncbi:hypothetical protein B484DRAFT_448818 [Ochromonadaceae sp. CCMP2298]|nr:hypothetical protein B484DRAFT_448818 [Ochromonadaceae sp. CCMP2298]
MSAVVKMLRGPPPPPPPPPAPPRPSPVPARAPTSPTPVPAWAPPTSRAPMLPKAAPRARRHGSPRRTTTWCRLWTITMPGTRTRETSAGTRCRRRPRISTAPQEACTPTKRTCATLSGPRSLTSSRSTSSPPGPRRTARMSRKVGRRSIVRRFSRSCWRAAP